MKNKNAYLPGFDSVLAGTAEICEVSVGTSDVAKLYGVSVQAVSKWRDRDCPCTQQENGEWRYPLAGVIQWRRESDIENASGRLLDDEKGGGDWGETLKMWRSKTEKVKYEKERGKLVEREKVKQDIGQCVGALSQELDAIGKAHGAAVSNDIADAMDRFLEELDVDGD